MFLKYTDDCSEHNKYEMEGVWLLFFPLWSSAFVYSEQHVSLAQCQYISIERQLLSGYNRFVQFIWQLGPNLRRRCKFAWCSSFYVFLLLPSVTGRSLADKALLFLMDKSTIMTDISQIWQALPRTSFIIHASEQFIWLCCTSRLDTHIRRLSISHVNIKKPTATKYIKK